MEFTRKFYDPNGNGNGGGSAPQGPSDQDINRAQSLRDVFVEMKDTLKSIGLLFSESISREVENLDRDSQRIARSLGRDLEKELRKAVKTTDQLRDSTSDVAEELRSVASVEAKIKSVKQQQRNIEDLITQIKLTQGDLTQEQEQYERDITEQLNQQLSLLGKQVVIQQQIESTMEGYAKTLKGIGNLPFFGPAFSKLLDIPEITKRMTKEAEKGGSKWKVLGAGIDETFKSVGKSLFGLLIAGFAKLIEIVIEFNQKTFDIAKNLGTSVDKAGELQGKFVAIANSSANAGLTAKDLSNTYAELSNSAGYLLPSTKEFAETTTLIQKRLGASAEQMSALAMQSALAGKSISSTYGIIQATTKIEGARNKIALTQRQILDAIAKTSSNVLINFKGNLEALTGAIVRATKLGTTLDQVNKQGESLLDFETSISKEFEAQVLTGRDMNLTKAREYALMGDTKNLMEELNKQGATYDQFMNENVIARQADAEAIGMQVGEYSKLLLQQKQANALGVQEGQSLTERYQELMKTVEGQKKLKEELSAQELGDLRRASIQDRFNAAIERFKDILGSTLQGPLTKMLDKFIAFVGNTERMQKIAEQIKTVFEGIGSVLSRFPSLLQSALEVSKVLTSLAVARAVASVAASAAATPVAGVVAAGIAGAAMYTWLNSITDGLMGGGGSPPGAGVVAGTEKAVMTQPVNTAVAAKTSAVTAATQAATAPTQITGNVYLDSAKVAPIVFNASQQDYSQTKK